MGELVYLGDASRRIMSPRYPPGEKLLTETGFLGGRFRTSSLRRALTFRNRARRFAIDLSITRLRISGIEMCH